MVVVRLPPILGNTQNSTPCQIRREWKWMRRRESWRVLSKISPHRSPDAPVPPVRLCPNLCVTRTILGLGHPSRNRSGENRRRRRRMRRRWRRTEEVSSEAATTSWSNGGFLVDRLLCLGTFCGTICCTYVRTAAHSHSHSYRTCLRTLLLHIILLCPFSDNPSKK